MIRLTDPAVLSSRIASCRTVHPAHRTPQARRVEPGRNCPGDACRRVWSSDRSGSARSGRASRGRSCCPLKSGRAESAVMRLLPVGSAGARYWLLFLLRMGGAVFFLAGIEGESWSLAWSALRRLHGLCFVPEGRLVGVVPLGDLPTEFRQYPDASSAISTPVAGPGVVHRNRADSPC